MNPPTINIDITVLSRVGTPEEKLLAHRVREMRGRWERGPWLCARYQKREYVVQGTAETGYTIKLGDHIGATTVAGRRGRVV